MSENLFIKKRQRDRRKQNFLTVKLILRLVVASVLLWLGFLYFVGDPTTAICENGCEGEFSLGTWIAAAAMVFGAVVVVGGLTGALIAFLRSGRSNSSLSVLISDDQNQKGD